MKSKPGFIRNLCADLLFFIQVALYWPVAFLVLKPLWWVDRKTGLGFFRHIDSLIKRMAGR
jgi:hypothetical protein